jgi:hypothetical protein
MPIEKEDIFGDPVRTLPSPATATVPGPQAEPPQSAGPGPSPVPPLAVATREQLADVIRRLNYFALTDIATAIEGFKKNHNGISLATAMAKWAETKQAD